MKYGLTFACHLIPVFPIVLAAPVEHLLAGFPPPQQNFDNHIEEVRDYLLVTQLDGRSPDDVEYNVPFELSANDRVPYRGRYLLIHGLNDSPAVWHDVALALSERGFDVRAILLPGHGNTPEAQLRVSWKHWLDTARLQLDCSIPINAAAQYYKTARYLQRRWHQQILTMPVLMVETMDDSVVDVQKTRHIFARRFGSPRRRLLLYSNDHTQAGSHEIIRPSKYPSFRILNQSHQGMMMSPKNTLFGQGATQLVCNGIMALHDQVFAVDPK